MVDENVEESMEVEPLVKEPEIVQQDITLEILPLIKEAQSQHGLKHGDYQRYRAYCARRVRRLRKSLDYVQSVSKSKFKSSYQQRKITNEIVGNAPKAKKDPLRYFLVTLMCTERCWAHAMALKQEANTEHRKKFHLVRKLRKAVLYGKELYALCHDEPNYCDARSKLEAEAYFCYISGLYFFETEKWKKASNLLKKAQAIYTKLCDAIADDDVLQLYHQRIDELKPTLRFCAFNLDDKDSKDLLDKMKGEKLADDDLLSSKLDQLILQAREKQAVTLSEVNWLGKVIAVKHEKIRAVLFNIQELDGVANPGVDQVEKLLFECRDCLQLLRDANQDKSPLFCYLLFLRNDLTCRRNLALIEGVEKKAELIRLYEVIIGSLNDIKSLPYAQYINNDDEIELLIQNIDAKVLAYQAFRCYFIGTSEKLATKESIAMLHRASQHALVSLTRSDFLDKALRQKLEQLRADADAEKYNLFANSLIEGDGEKSSSLTDGKLKNKPLIEKLDLYNEDPNLAQGASKLAHFPPDFKPIACKPLFFDLALNHIEMPSLDNEMKAATGGGITGFVKGWIGWGGKK